ncbi:MAG: hypothetical protein M3S32_10365 [Acidobacteriota bacterium]|nr:hypothetical protein [Acidobacteriota bacterium]
MKRHRRMAIAAAWVMTAGTVLAQAGKPGDVYLELISASKKATTFDQIAPYLSAAVLQEMKSMPASMKNEWLKGMKDTLNLADVQWTKQTITGDKAILEAKAKNGAGKAATGRVEMVREKGAWKFTDHAWAAPA